VKDTKQLLRIYDTSMKNNTITLTYLHETIERAFEFSLKDKELVDLLVDLAYELGKQQERMNNL
jgi:hypothetical protein